MLDGSTALLAGIRNRARCANCPSAEFGEKDLELKLIRGFAQLPVHFEPVAFLAVRLEGGLKREAIEGAFDRRHAARRKLRTRVLWQNKKTPGADLAAVGRPA